MAYAERARRARKSFLLFQKGWERWFCPEILSLYIGCAFVFELIAIIYKNSSTSGVDCLLYISVYNYSALGINTGKVENNAVAPRDTIP